jgi:hypothetical protein
MSNVIKEQAIFDDEAIEALKSYECPPPNLQQAVVRQCLTSDQR